VDPVEDLQYAIERYRSVVPMRKPSGDPPPRVRDVAGDVRELRDLIAPLVLPRELEWFWTTISPEVMGAQFDVFPSLVLRLPEMALHTWRAQDGGEFPGMPRNLMAVAYEGHGFFLADTSAASDDIPAPLWHYYYGDATYRLWFPSLAGLLRCVADFLEAAGIQVPEDRSAWYANDVVGSDYFDEVRRTALAKAGLDSAAEVSVDDQRQWPERWQIAHGLTSDAMRPLGATHTVNELIFAAEGGPLTARLHGWCTGYVGPIELDGERFGVRTFSDGSGSMKVLQPVVLQTIGPGGGRETAVEVEVECPGPIRTAPEATDGCNVTDALTITSSDDPGAAIDAMVSRRFGNIENAPRIRRMVALP
jgi:hypothetical protein